MGNRNIGLVVGEGGSRRNSSSCFVRGWGGKAVIENG